MSSDDLVVTSLPFILSVVILLVNSGLRNFVKRNAEVVFPNFSKQSNGIQTSAIDLAVYTYLHISFVFSTLTSSFASIVLVLTSSRPTLAIVGTAIPLLAIPWWMINGLGLPVDELETGKKGRWMRIFSWVSIIVLFVVTVYAKQ